MTSQTNGADSGMKPAFELTADDLIRVFNDPDGELRHYDFKFRGGPPSALNFSMELPFDKIKASVEKVKQDIFQNIDCNASQRPRFEHVGSTSIKGVVVVVVVIVIVVVVVLAHLVVSGSHRCSSLFCSLCIVSN